MEISILYEFIGCLQTLGNGFDRGGTFKMRVLLNMLLYEIEDEIERREKRVQPEAKLASP